MDPVGLGNLLANLPKNKDPNLLVGYETCDDAGVYRLTDDLAIIMTADYITPPVNDPYIYGQIAAANAISDVYAMGGQPIACLNLVSFPSKKLPPEVLHEIVAGALSKITEAGAVLAGGHSVEDDEPKFGLAVTGIVHPDKFWTNQGAQPGDVLILTKPVGSGVLFNANLKKWVSKEAMEACLSILITLNRTAAKVMSGFDIHAATDVTGFGLAGHGFEMAKASGVCLEISIKDLPIMDEALMVYKKGMTTGVNAYNRQMVEKHLWLETDLPPWHEEIVFDPQTSGGLLVAVTKTQGENLVNALHAKGVTAAKIIGNVHELKAGIHLKFR
ncbi:MAG: selenide, water dikinase SelD [Proteobacteria bacterium]|nr:selenide, water dikinase SelD [Pseudomonadota bacterium]